MKISIITAASRPSFMNRVWKSISSQTHKDWEWIIVTGGFSGIKKWYEDFKKMYAGSQSIVLIDTVYDKGRFGLYNRNVGAMTARYNRIVFLDDDNEWEPNHLESLVNLEKKTGKIPYSWMHVKGKKPGSDVDVIKKTGFSKQGIDLGCILWRRDLFDRYGYFRDDSQVTYDWNHMARVAFGEGLHRFICTDEPTLIFWHKRY